MPGSRTCAASRVAWVPATRQPASLTVWDCARYRVRKASSPPIPRSTRSPATVSAPRAVSRPASSRWALWRRWRGFMTNASDATSSGPPNEHDEPEQERAAQQDDRDDDERHDRAHEAREDVEAVAHPAEVAREAGQHLAGWHRAGQGGAGAADRPVGDHPGPEGGDEPVLDGEPVPAVAGDRRDQPEPHDGERPQDEGTPVTGDDPVVDGPAHGGRDEGDGEHPRDAEGGAREEGAPLAACEPHEQAVGVGRREVVGSHAVLPRWSLRHGASTLGRGTDTAPTGFRPRRAPGSGRTRAAPRAASGRAPPGRSSQGACAFHRPAFARSVTARRHAP